MRIWFRPRVLLLCLLFVGLGLLRAAAGDEAWPKTVAESSEYRATARAAEVQAFVESLAAKSDRVRVGTFGQSVEGRPLVSVVAGAPLPATAPRDADDQRLVVLLIGGIHSGECDGKEALLALLRDAVADPKHRWWQQLVLVVVPNFNVDGGERVGTEHRPGQVGPEQGAGRRENAQELDLNRDFIKLETPEVRALVQLAREWDADVVIDTHTTNGSHHRYTLTYDVPHHPAAPRPPVEFLRNQLLPTVTQRLDEQGIGTFYYGNFNSDSTRWTTYGLEPRYGTEYFGLCGRLSILAESYSYATYEARVKASQAFVAACLDELTTHHAQVRELRQQTAASLKASGRDPQPEDQVPIAGKIDKFPEKTAIRGYQKGPDGAETPHDIELEFWGRGEPTKSVRRPYAYVLPYEASRSVARLVMHGVRVEQLTSDVTAAVESSVAEKVERSGRPFQQHALVTLHTKRTQQEQRLPAKSYVVRLDQPLGNLIVNLLEPESQDGLATWNFFDVACWEAGDRFPVDRLLEPIELPLQAVTSVPPAQKLDLDQIYGPKRRVNFGGGGSSGARWLPNSDSYLREFNGQTMRVAAETGAVSPFFESEKVVAALAKLPEFSTEDAQRLGRSLHSLSPQADAQLIVHEKDLYYVRLDGSAARRLTHDVHPERLPEFSPDGKLVAFVREHNLHVVSVDDGRGWAVTVDGNANHLFGELDWVYQEEIYGRGNFRGFWWSPDSRRLALLEFDETPVHRYTVTNHIPYRQDLEVTAYPKAGDPLPRVRLGIAPAVGGDITWVDDYEYSSADLLIARVAWHPAGDALYYQVQDRAQTWLDLRRAEAGSGSNRRILREAGEAWIDPLDDPVWLKNGDFLWLSPRSGFVHAYRITADGAKVTPLTSGEWEIRSLARVDANEQWCYFQATREHPTREQIYRVALAGGEPERLTTGQGTHTGRFNDARTYFVHSFSGVNSPAGTRICRADGSLCHVLAAPLDDHWPYYFVAEPESVHLAARDGHPLDGLLIKPPDFDPQRKYPVLCYVYGGPQAPVVRDRWGGNNYLWHQMLAQQGYCVWLCDNRAASHRGIKHTWKVHRRLGEQELSDLEDGVAWLKAQPWVDGDRIGMWGWSYGGYFTSYALTHSKLFRAGIAGAPVTDWRNYDAVYTERLMGLPQTNAEGYQRSSVIEAAGNLHGRLLLIHGDADDNVHLANTLQLVRALQRSGKEFDMMIYPQNRHGITQPQQSRHLQETMTRFLRERL